MAEIEGIVLKPAMGQAKIQVERIATGFERRLWASPKDFGELWVVEQAG
jgi:hypothetical protein